MAVKIIVMISLFLAICCALPLEQSIEERLEDKADVNSPV